jgi:very-short-patch-repair endonuclease
MDEQIASTDGVIAKIASAQHGVVEVRQLRAAGIGKDSVWKAVQAGRLHRVFRGVYAVGHPGLSSEGRWMAAVLACGEGAVLSHRSAAELWRLLPRRCAPVDVTVPSDAGRRRRDGLRIHRSLHLIPSVRTIRDRIAVTTPARTLGDLRRVASAGLVRKATRQAEYLGLSLGEIETDGTRSELERAFLGLCRRHRLPMPEVNATVGPYTVDFLWPGDRLVVETDGYGSHRGRQAFEDDRARELYLHTAGYRVRRFTDTQVHDQPAALATSLRAELGPRWRDLRLLDE